MFSDHSAQTSEKGEFFSFCNKVLLFPEYKGPMTYSRLNALA